MHIHITWVCDICGMESTDKSRIARCELQHRTDMSLSDEDVTTYHELKTAVKDAMATISMAKNELTDKACDDSITALLDFENKHDMK